MAKGAGGRSSSYPSMTGKRCKTDTDDDYDDDDDDVSVR